MTTIYDAIESGGDLIATCCSPKCGTRTQLEVRFFAAGRSLDTPLDRIAKRIACAKCGDPVILSVRNALATIRAKARRSAS